MSLVLINNASSTLASSLSSSSTSLILSAGQGSLFPVLATGDWHPLTLIRSDGQYEIVRATARSSDTITIQRAQEGTSALPFSAGDGVEIRLTKAAIDEFALSGQQDFTVLRGINYGVSTGSIGSNQYNVNVASVSSYTNNLRIAVLPHSANASGNSQVNVNALGNVTILLPDGTSPQPGAISDNRVMHLRYRSSDGSFILDNAIAEGQSLASDTSAGLAQRGVEESYDVNGDNIKFTTQRTVSRMIEDSIPDSENLPFQWRHKGDAKDGGTFQSVSGDPKTLSTGRSYEFQNLNIQSGGSLTLAGNGTCVIRCTDTITIDDEIVMPRGAQGSGIHVGPTGGDATSGTLTVKRSVVPSNPHAQGGQLTLEQFFYHVQNATAFHNFQGGHGEASNTQMIVQDPGAGLILIASTINIGAGADFKNMFAKPSSGFNGPSAGGILILVANAITVDNAASFEAGAAGNFEDRAFWSDTVTNGNQVANAGNGQCFILSLNTSLPGQVF